MKKYFLNADHWQVFLITFALPLVLQFSMIYFYLFDMILSENPNPEAIIELFEFFPILILLYMGLPFLWYWSIAMGLKKYLPDGVELPYTFFKFCFFTPLIYVFIFSNVISSSMSAEFLENDTLASGFIIAFVVLFLLHFLTMYCIFYCYYFIAKVYKSVEHQKEERFGNFIGEFFMLWFYPIGIWILQPRLRKLIKKLSETHQN